MADIRKIEDVNFSAKEGAISFVIGLGAMAVGAAAEIGGLFAAGRLYPYVGDLGVLLAVPPVAPLVLGAMFTLYGAGNLLTYPFRIAHAHMKKGDYC